MSKTFLVDLYICIYCINDYKSYLSTVHWWTQFLEQSPHPSPFSPFHILSTFCPLLSSVILMLATTSSSSSIMVSASFLCLTLLTSSFSSSPTLFKLLSMVEMFTRQLSGSDWPSIITLASINHTSGTSWLWKNKLSLSSKAFLQNPIFHLRNVLDLIGLYWMELWPWIEDIW